MSSRSMSSHLLRGLVLAAATAVVAVPAAHADEAAIRKNLLQRLPDLPAIDEISKSPIPGLYEIRVGTDLYYTDENGNYFLSGQILDTKTRTNLTAERIAKLTAINFNDLALKDAVVWKQGTGARKMVVFADPNCGYCKKLERDMAQIKDVTVYTFLIPILGGDSAEKTRSIWCAKDSSKVWRDWMVGNVAPPRVMGACDDTALQRNMELAQKHKVNSTPSLVFEDGRRVPGAAGAADIEKYLSGGAKKS